MKAALFSRVVGLLLLVVFADRTKQTIECGCNMKPTECLPCNPICGEAPRFCPAFCPPNASYCECLPGFALRTPKSKSCIPEENCPPKRCETIPTPF